MKNVVVIGVLCLLSFVLGVVVLFWAMPYVSPDLVENTRHRLDSLSGVALRAETMTGLHADSVLLDDPTTGEGTVADSLLTGDATMPTVGALQDSMQTIMARLAEAQREQKALVQQKLEAESMLETSQAHAVEIAALSSTLTKLEVAELTPVLDGLTMDELGILYQQSSDRDRGRLLRAMSPERAARLIKDLISQREQPGVPAESEAKPATG